MAGGLAFKFGRNWRRGALWLAGVLLLVVPAARGVDTNTYLLGYSPYHNIYRLDLGTGVATVVYSGYPGGDSAAMAIRPSDGMIFYVENLADGGVYRWNPATPATAPVKIGTLGSTVADGVRMTFSPGGTLYFMDYSGGKLYTVNQTSGAATLSGTITGAFNPGGDLTFGPDGTFYLVDGNEIYTASTSGGAASLVGTVTGITGSIAGASFAASGRMIVLTYDATTTYSYSVNMSTLAATLIGSAGTLDLGTDLASITPLNTDLAVTVSGATSIAPSGSLTYTVTVANNGPNAALDVVVTDTLPSAVTYVSSSGSGSLSGSVVRWPTISSLASGGSVSYTVTVTAPASGTFTNTVAGSSFNIDTVPANNDGSAAGANVVTSIATDTDVRATISAPTTVMAAGALSYTITVTNAGMLTATNIVVQTVATPATAGFLSASGGGDEVGGGVVVWPAFSLASGSSTNLTLVVSLPSTGTLTNTVSSTADTDDPNATNNDGSAAGAKAVTTITPSVPVGGLTGCVTATNVATTSWSQTIDNGANRLLLVGVSFAGTSRYITSMTYGGVAMTLVGSAGVNRRVELWRLLNPTVGTGTILANWSGSSDVVFWSGSFTNVDQTTPFGTFQSASGNSTTPSVTVSSATGQLVVDVMAAAGDAGTINPGSAQALICSGNTGTSSGDARGGGSSEPGASSVTMTWSLSNSKVWDIGAVAIRPAPPPQADVATSTSGATTVLAGANLTYTITVTNFGPFTATNVIVKDTIPTASTFYSASGGGTYSGGVVTWPGFNLDAGTSTNVTLTVTAPGSGTLTNTGRSTATTYDPDASNNNGSSGAVVTTITPQGTPSVVGTSCVTANGVSTKTWSHTVPSGNNRILIVGLSLRDKSRTVTSITYGGTALTKIGSSNVRMGVELWRLVAPTVGTANIVANWSGSSDMVGWSGSFTNVNQTSPTGSIYKNNGSSTTPSVTVVSAVGDLVIDTLSTKGDANSTSLGAGQTLICSGALGTGGSDGRGASSSEAGAASVTMSWTLGSSKDWEIAAVALKAAAPAQADVATTVSGPASVAAGSSITYTVSVNNLGPVAATNLVVTDTLPAGVTFVSASSGGVHSGGVITWPTISALAAGGSTSYTAVVTVPAVGTLTNLVASTATTSDPDATNNNGSGAGARVVTIVTGMNVAGYAYVDANRNGFRDGAEAGTGLTLYAKLVPTSAPAGPATQAVAVNGATGTYLLTGVAVGSYTVILDNNATLSDVTPTLPAGWSGTEMPGQTRTVVVTAGVDLSNQNFGLVNAITLSGKVFLDTGAGSGTANDGVPNGAEAGKQGVVVKLTDNTGATTYDTATTDGAGNYSLLVPSAVPNGTVLKVVETNPTGFSSTGGGVGNTGGTYDRTTDTVTFTLAAGTVYTGVNFGDVPANTFVNDSQQNGSAGNFVLHAHTFTAGSAGTVAFSVSSAPKPAIAGWSQVIFLDANGNGQLDAGEAIITAAVTVNAGDKVSILVKDFIPGTAPFNAQDQLTVTAMFTYTGASPALTATATRTALTTVGKPAGNALVLLKAADRDTVLPGQVITYTVTYANRSAEPLGNVVIFDEVPAFTTFASASAGALGSGLTGVTISAPGTGSTGPVRWTFTGSLSPGASGSVSYAVTLAQ